MNALWFFTARRKRLSAEAQQSLGAWLARHVRRWVWALGGAFVGLALVYVWAADVYEAHGLLQQKVQGLRAAVLASSASPAGVLKQTTATRSPGLAQPWVDHLPTLDDVPSLWLALQKGLEPQGLTVQALKPQALQADAALPSQAVALRLQGRFADGAKAWASLVDAGPVWTIDRMTVTVGAQSGALHWDGVWRVWLRPDAPSARAWPAGWDVSVRQSTATVAAVDPFMVRRADATLPALSASEPLPGPLSPDPRQWPLAQIRLWGVWQQGGRYQAVLGAAAHWAVLGPGAFLALEGYRVQTVQPDAVWLQPRSGQGPAHVLRLEGSLR